MQLVKFHFRLFLRYIRRKIGLVVRYSYSGSYRFCYSSRGTPGGSTPSLLLLHGFSASKDMWLTLVPVTPPLQTQPLVLKCKPGNNFVFGCINYFIPRKSANTGNTLCWVSTFVSSHRSPLSTSFSQRASMLSVWTCRVTRERAAPGRRTTVSRVRSAESTRSVSVRRREPFRPCYYATCGVRVKVHSLRPSLTPPVLWSLVTTRFCLLIEEQHRTISSWAQDVLSDSVCRLANNNSVV